VALMPQDRFFLLACDGIWDVMTNQQVPPPAAAAAASLSCSWCTHELNALARQITTGLLQECVCCVCQVAQTMHLETGVCAACLQAVDFVNERLDRGMKAGPICVELLDACLAKNPKEARGIGCDNMTANVVVFK